MFQQVVCSGNKGDDPRFSYVVIGSQTGRRLADRGIRDYRQADRAASDAAKDARIDALLVRVGELTAQVQALVLRLGKDSSSSSKPPSSDGPGRASRGGSSRKASGRRPGKQPGEPGTALRLVEEPEERIPVPAPAACRCGTWLAEQDVVGVRRRQVHDLAPIPDPVVTKYAAEVKCCPGCRAEAVGEFPAGVGAPAQYGPEITTRVAETIVSFPSRLQEYGYHTLMVTSNSLAADPAFGFEGYGDWG